MSGETAPDDLKTVTDLSFDGSGNLSGSRLTMDMACRNFMRHTGSDMVTAFRMASGNPARALGMDDEIGTVEKGKKADLVFCDGMFNVKNVMLNGRIVNSGGEI